MPYTITTKDNIKVENVPDDMQSNDPRLVEFVKRVRASLGPGTYSFAAMPTVMPQPEPVAPPALAGEQQSRTDALGLMGAAVRGAGPIAMGAALGAAAGAPIGGVGAIPGAAAGAGAMALTQFVGDPLVDLINTALGTSLTKPTEALQQFFTELGIPEPDTAAERVLQAASAAGAGSAGTVALGEAIARGSKTLAPTMVKALGEALASGPRAQVVGGAASGAAQQATAEAGGSPALQIGAGVAAGTLGSALGGLQAKPVPPAPIKEAEQLGVRVLTSDVRPPQTAAAKWLQRRSEELPLGAGGLRSAQAKERVEAVRDVLRQYGAEDVASASAEVMDDLLRTRSATLSKWVAAKDAVIDGLGADGTPVPMPATLAKIDQGIEYLKGLKTTEVKGAIDVLADWREAVQGQSLRNVDTLRKQIGDVFATPDLASSRSATEKVLSGIYGAVKDDMTSYIEKTGGKAQLAKWQVANKELSKMAQELERPALKAALEKGNETPELIGTLLFSRKKSDVEALYKNLSPDGRAAARAAILSKAAQAAESAGEVSPDRFVNSVKKLGDQVGVMFTGEDLKTINGLTRVLEYTKHAATATSQPLTGAQLVLPAGAAALGAGLGQVFGKGWEGFAAALAVGAAAGSGVRVYESKAVRDMLAKLPALKAGSPEEFALLKRLMSAVQAQEQAPKKQGSGTKPLQHGAAREY